MSNAIKVMAILLARPGKQQQLEDLLFGMAPACRAEPGNQRWDIWRDQVDKGRFVLDELYDGDASIAAHRETPHYRHYASQINTLAERVAIVLDPAEVACAVNP